MKLALFLPSKPDIKWQLGKQIGVNHAIVKLHPDLTQMPPPYKIDTLVKVKKQFADAGYKLYGLESDEFEMSRIKYGLAGRDEDIEKYNQMIRNCGELNIPMICYNFMPTGWYRTKVDREERGGALTTAFNFEDAKKLPIAQYGEFTTEQMWKNYTYFIQNIMPVADKAKVKMALHPDDPPVSPLHGVARIFTNAESFRNAMLLYPSEYNGIAFCQATFKAMGEDIRAIAREFGKQKKIFFIHIRDIEGTEGCFYETFHDNGPTDMVEMFRIYKEIGFDGPIRPDHAPSLAGESNQNPGYSMLGKIFAFGYFKGIMNSLDINID